MTTATQPTFTPAVGPANERVRATWNAGDFGRIATSYARGASQFVNRVGVAVGERVLDVACGTGNLALPAARAGARVTGVDIAPALLEQARERAATENLVATFDEGDCEQLPYSDASFDVVLSMFGVMFAAHPDRAAAELIRVCRPGGRVALASWMPDGFIGQMLRTTVAYAPLPAGSPSPLLWGDASVVRQRLGTTVAKLSLTARSIEFEFPFAPSAVVEYFREFYGPSVRAYAATDPVRRDALSRDLERLWESRNRASDGTTLVDAEYLEAIAVVR
jgi:SAM-dependent methyltransferase